MGSSWVESQREASTPNQPAWQGGGRDLRNGVPAQQALPGDGSTTARGRRPDEIINVEEIRRNN